MIIERFRQERHNENVCVSAACSSYGVPAYAQSNLYVNSSNGNVGVGTTSPLAALDVQNGVTSASGVAYGVRYQQTLTASANNDALTALYINPTFSNGAYTGVANNGLIVDSGNVLIGATTPYQTPSTGSPYTPIFQITGTTSPSATAAFQRWSNDTVAPYFIISKSRGTTPGSDGAVLSGDQLANIRATGDGGSGQIAAGQLSFLAAGNFTSSSAPTYFSVFVTPNNSTTLTEAMRIEDNQHIDFTGSAYTVSGCGGSPTIAGNDVVGRITIGSSPTTACTVDFSSNWRNAPFCSCNDETTAVGCRASGNTVSQVTLNGSFVAGDKVSFGCTGYF